jgi:hypothetical protein
MPGLSVGCQTQADLRPMTDPSVGLALSIARYRTRVIAG